jgi:hypothetical protein
MESKATHIMAEGKERKPERQRQREREREREKERERLCLLILAFSLVPFLVQLGP